MKVSIASPEDILALTKKLCAVPSVSGCARQEDRVADLLLEQLQGIVPTGGNALEVLSLPCAGDRLGRKAVWALLRAAKKTTKTVLLTGHFDVVETQGALASLAFDLEAYTKALSRENLPRDAREDLLSGNWLFGRGSMDMKAGLALFVLAIRSLARCEDLKLNIAFLAVPDEESDSAGMRGTVSALKRIIDAEGLDMQAALTGEPCFWSAGANPTRPYYTGSTGKIMPYFLCVGRASHVNDYAEGANAALIAAHVVRLMEGNADFVDGTGDETLAPPVCLSCETRTGTYSVSLPSKAVCYFNVLTTSKTPFDVLEASKELARKALADACGQMQATHQMLAEKGSPVPAFNSVGRVLAYEELVGLAVERVGDQQAFAAQERELLARIPARTDARERAIEVSEWMLAQSGLVGPAIVVGFLPPYYPHRVNRNRNAKERRLRRVIEAMSRRAGVLARDAKTSFREVFGGISDLSYLGFEGKMEELMALRTNMPGWGEVFDLPMQDLVALDIPVANMGPAGRDAHKATERLELDFSLRVAPQLLMETLEALGEAEEPDGLV